MAKGQNGKKKDEKKKNPEKSLKEERPAAKQAKKAMKG